MAAPALLRFEHAHRNDLAAIRGFVEAQASAAGVSADVIDDLVQAVDEAATNIIVHGYHDQPGWLEVEFARAADHISLTLRDQAPPFDPRQAPLPDLRQPLHQRKPGGLGVYLMRKCTDRLDYRPRDGGGNELVLTKHIES